ncbi:hypothetical protein SLEP1_g60170 [Rubroshorea leprosula]|uniref:Uncharacterized protein n=1 Tax=Rubroshorea leprosula TaxID=152421 RepID=A0AAV5MUH2_9ROSI|nr:hypothetical protein SLEP1_g60170 [Rubroshorea leprosula]
MRSLLPTVFPSEIQAPELSFSGWNLASGPQDGLGSRSIILACTPDECAASSIPADSIAGDEIAKVTDSIAKSAFCPEIPFDAY